MSGLSDLLEGNFSAIGGDLWGTPTKDLETIGGVLGAFGVGEGIAGLAGAGAAAGGAAAGAGAPLDLLSFGSAAGTADAAAVGTDVGITGATGGLDLSGGADALSFLDPAAGGAAADPGIAAINGAAPLGATAGAAAPDAGTLSIPGMADQALSATDLAGVTTDPGSAAAGTPSFLSNLVSGATNSLTKNPLGIAAAGAGLGLSFLRGNQTDPNQQQLQNEAPGLQAQGAAITASGQQLTTYLQNGTLPPGQQAAVTQAVQSRKASIIANAAANGQNTNPAQNSALAQDLANADQDGLVMAGQLEQQLATTGTQLITTGLNETGLSEQIYETLTKMDQTNNATLMASIASMAAALGGGTKIQIGGTATA